MTKPPLCVENLGKRYGGHRVFQGVTFGVSAGQHLALLGSSGCGKSTLLRLLAGLDTPDEGNISMGGRLVSEPGRTLVPPHERRLAMVFQDLALWPTLSALDNVLLGMANTNLPGPDRRSRAHEILKRCRLESCADRKPAALSVGQQQRVALARALSVRPALLLMDEPFASLDLVIKHELFETVRAVSAECALVLVTHDPLEALALCDSALVMEHGDIAERGALRDLLASPRSDLLRLFQQHQPPRP